MSYLATSDGQAYSSVDGSAFTTIPSPYTDQQINSIPGLRDMLDQQFYGNYNQQYNDTGVGADPNTVNAQFQDKLDGFVNNPSSFVAENRDAALSQFLTAAGNVQINDAYTKSGYQGAGWNSNSISMTDLQAQAQKLISVYGFSPQEVQSAWQNESNQTSQMIPNIVNTAINGGKETTSATESTIAQFITAAVIAITAPELAPAIGSSMGLTGAAASSAGYAAFGAGTGAVLSASKGESTDKIIQAALIGGATGAIGGAAQPIASAMGGGDAASLIANTGAGALKSAVSGGNPLAGAAGGAVGTGLVEAGLPTSLAGAAGGAASASIGGQDPAKSAAASFITNLASGSYRGYTDPTAVNVGEINPSVPQYASNVEVSSAPMTDANAPVLLGPKYMEIPPDKATLSDWLDAGILTPDEYQKGLQIANAYESSTANVTPPPDQRILDLISKQSGSGSVPSASLSTGQTSTGFGMKSGAGKGEGAGGVGNGGGGGGTGDGSGGGDPYTSAPGISTIGKSGSTLGSQGAQTSGGSSDTLASALLGSNIGTNPAEATGDPNMLKDGQRKDVWNLESLRGALGV